MSYAHTNTMYGKGSVSELHNKVVLKALVFPQVFVFFSITGGNFYLEPPLKMIL